MQEDILIMSAKERQRKVLMAGVLDKRISLKEASIQMGVSYRHSRRILKRYRFEGDAGLTHKNRGRKPNCAKSNKLKLKVLQLYEAHYCGFGPTFTSELLLERDGLEIHPETLRSWLKNAGLWRRQRKRKSYRQRRERKSQFGELIQVDGSHHDWLGDGKLRCLMHMVDDATGRSLAALSDSGESTEAAFKILQAWIKKYGVPRALYVDRHVTYVGTARKDSEPSEPCSHFANACKALGIRLIKARSPQAKGRVERKHALFQDRFCKQIKLNNIQSIKRANDYLKNSFLPQVNRKYCIKPSNPNDAHLPLALNLYQTLVVREKRQVQNDFTVSFHGLCWQLKSPRRSGLNPKQTVTIKRHLDNVLTVWAKGKKIDYQLIAPSERTVMEPKPRDPKISAAHRRKRVNDSPWRKFNPEWLSA